MEEKKETKRIKNEKGVAYLVVMSTLAILAVLSLQMQQNSALNSSLSTMVKDKIKSEYNAKSGFNLALYLFTIGDAVTLYTNQMMGSKEPAADSQESHWNLINSLPPIGGDMILALNKSKNPKDPFQLLGVMNKKNREIMQLFSGSFQVNINDENGKINLNNCLSGQCKETVDSLEALFSSPAESAFLESKDINPKELAYSIKDFINNSPNASLKSGTRDESAYYRNQEPPYVAKNRPLDDISELKLIRGFEDDEVYEIFSPYMTVYPVADSSGTKPILININTAKPELIASLVPSSLENQCREKFIKKMAQLQKDRQAPASSKEAIKNFFSDTLCYSADGGAKKEDRQKWFTTKSEAFQFTIVGNTNKMQTRLKVVIQRAESNGKSGSLSQKSSGRSYQILSWH